MAIFSFNNQKRLRFWRFLFMHLWGLTNGGFFTGFRLIMAVFEGKIRGYRFNADCVLTFLYYELSNTFAIGYSLFLVRARWIYSCLYSPWYCQILVQWHPTFYCIVVGPLDCLFLPSFYRYNSFSVHISGETVLACLLIAVFFSCIAFVKDTRGSLLNTP